MNHTSDTPPDGDFARYVEELTRRGQPAVPVMPADMRKPLSKADSKADSGVRETAAFLNEGKAVPPLAATLQTAFRGISFWKHVSWLVVLWILTEVLSRRITGAGFVMFPLLAFYAYWLFRKLNQNLDGALMRRLQTLAEQSASNASRPK